MRSLFELPNVQLQVGEAARVYANIAAQQHQQMLMAVGPHTNLESPIEAIFWIWWTTLEGLVPGRDFGFGLAPQYEVECEGNRYRLDFAVPEYLIAVELDGHDFHEKTKEQVTYRNQRDRHLQAAGWTVFHFSGSELYRNEVDCVSAVANLARERHAAAKARGAL